MKIKIDNVLKNFNSHFERAGFKAYLVGGAVRDIFLHKKPHDFDVATNATPQNVEKIQSVNIFSSIIRQKSQAVCLPIPLAQRGIDAHPSKNSSNPPIPNSISSSRYWL